jgi:UPF0755 protein
MNDIATPKRPLSQPQPPAKPPVSQEKTGPILSIPEDQLQAPYGGKKQKKPRNWRRILAWSIGSIIALILIIGAAGLMWYQDQLGAIAPGSKQQVRVEVFSGMGPGDIAGLLQDKGLIKNQQVFGWYVRLEGVENKLQAGQYTLGKGMTVQEIVVHLQKGHTDTFRITFYPGGVLRDTTDRSEKSKTDVTSVLKRAGYTDEAIAVALKKQYDHPLFASKPVSADLEGYVYGETYEFNSSVSIEDILKRTFDEMYAVVQEHDLIKKYKKRGLNLFEGITLASIVQREDKGPDQKMIAGVFYNRLKEGMPLGSDPTYQYIADKTGQMRDPSLDSPYNTRKYAGLPPGPIASPGESALLAVTEPTSSNYLFFLSGDDDKTYFARTEAEHERNIREHCQQKCLIP